MGRHKHADILVTLANNPKLELQFQVNARWYDSVGHEVLANEDDIVRIKNKHHVLIFEGLYDTCVNISMDNDVNIAIINGSWPSADECISVARQRQQELLSEKQSEQDYAISKKDEVQ
jgi:hypothetical protein